MEVQLKKARLRKRMKVRTSPNSKFADIIKNRKTQLAAGEAIPDKEDEKESGKSDFILDCILIERLFSYINFNWVGTGLFG